MSHILPLQIETWLTSQLLSLLKALFLKTTVYQVAVSDSMFQMAKLPQSSCLFHIVFITWISCYEYP